MIFLNTTFANELASSAYVSTDMKTLVFNTVGGVSTAEEKKDFPTTPVINLARVSFVVVGGDALAGLDFSITTSDI